MKLNLKIFILLFLSCWLSLQATNQKIITSFESTKILGTIEQVAQKINEKGVVEVKGEFYKPITSSNLKLTIKYKNENNIWIDGWCKEFKSNEIYNKNLNAKLELPAKSSSIPYELKIEVTASQLDDLNEVYWNKSIKHYKEGTYNIEFVTKPKVEIDPNKYSILLTPNTLNTIKYDKEGKLLALEDRAKTVPYFRKYYNEMLLSNADAELKNDGLNNYISVKRKSNDDTNDFLISTKDYIYEGSETDQYVYPYHDPVFIYAGKFPSEGFQIFYARYGDLDSGSSLYDFTNPNNLKGRIFNVYNNYNQKLSDIFKPGEPIVLVASTLTGTRIYKKDGTFFHLTGHTNFNPTSIYSGFPDMYYSNGVVEKRGPGNERFYFKMDKNSEFSFYGMGAIGNYEVLTGHRPMSDVEKDIKEFIDYTGIFEEKSACESNLLITIHEENIDANILAAPNSYIYDINLSKSNNYGGIYIPIKKAYDVWKDTNGFIKETIPNGKQSVSIVWQDKEDLVNSLTVEGSGEEAKLKVEINPTKGKGNAVLALHIGENGNDSDPIYWSWHVWITDDPTVDALTYVNNADDRMRNTFMDRNLGALNDSFFGNNWHKSGGLMYQWGRKDPVPIIFYKDSSESDFFTKDGRIHDINSFSKLLIDRPYDRIEDNLLYSIKNPLKFIQRKEKLGSWFASLDNNMKVEDSENYDLWGDNNKGIVRNESFEKQVKSPYDPCPAGWRVPSFAHSESSIPNFSPWGSRHNYSFDEDPNYNMNESSTRYPSVKFYPGIGVDFREGVDNYNLGHFPLTGAYKKLADGTTSFQDASSELTLWSATTNSYVQGRFLHVVNDPHNGSGKYIINTSQNTNTSEGLAVRCSKDEVTNLNFPTEYFVSNSIKRDYKDGINNPNSYILYNKKDLSIPVNKAYSVYNQELTDRDWIPTGVHTANVHWTTNPNLIKSLNTTSSDESGKINIELNDNQYGNAIVSLHIGNKGNSDDDVFWSWHIWVPQDNPEEASVEYITDNSNRKSSFKEFDTQTGFPPIKSEFMRMSLGSIKNFDTNQNYVSRQGYGLMYQWGRKDPLPSFHTAGWGEIYPIFVGKNNKNQITYERIEVNYEPSEFKDEYVGRGYQIINKQNELIDTKDVLSFSVKNPLSIMLNNETAGSDWLTNQIAYKSDRWGHATSKSIYDPCPEGWRVPDFSFNTVFGSPWVKSELKHDIPELGFDRWTVLTDYNLYDINYSGFLAYSRFFSYFYNSHNYNLGFNVPAQGYKGLSANMSIGLFESDIESRIWSSLISNSRNPILRGRAYSLATSRYAGIHDPSFNERLNNAQNIVCSKDTPKFTKEYFENLNNQKSRFKKISRLQKNNLIEDVWIYPNPVENVLRININEPTNFRIYELSGQKVQEGTFYKGKVNVSQLRAGLYILVLENGKTFKVLKK